MPYGTSDIHTVEQCHHTHNKPLSVIGVAAVAVAPADHPLMAAPELVEQPTAVPAARYHMVPGKELSI